MTPIYTTLTQTVKTTLKKNIKVIVLTHGLDVSESLVNLRAAGVESSLSNCVRQSSIGSSCYAMSPCLSSSKCQMLFKMAPGPKENNQESVINCEWIPAESTSILVRRSAVLFVFPRRIIFGEKMGFQFSVNVPVASGCNIENRVYFVTDSMANESHSVFNTLTWSGLEWTTSSFHLAVPGKIAGISCGSCGVEWPNLPQRRLLWTLRTPSRNTFADLCLLPLGEPCILKFRK